MMVVWLIGGLFTHGVMSNVKGTSVYGFMGSLVDFVIWPAVLGEFVGETVIELLKEKKG